MDMFEGRQSVTSALRGLCNFVSNVGGVERMLVRCAIPVMGFVVSHCASFWVGEDLM